VAWGWRPNTADGIKRETAASLRDRLEEAMGGPLTRGEGGLFPSRYVRLAVPRNGRVAALPASPKTPVVPDCFELLTKLSK